MQSWLVLPVIARRLLLLAHLLLLYQSEALPCYCSHAVCGSLRRWCCRRRTVARLRAQWARCRARCRIHEGINERRAAAQVSLPTQYNGKNQSPVGALSGTLARLQANRPLRELREIAKGVTKQLPDAIQARASAIKGPARDRDCLGVSQASGCCALSHRMRSSHSLPA